MREFAFNYSATDAKTTFRANSTIFAIIRRTVERPFDRSWKNLAIYRVYRSYPVDSNVGRKETGRTEKEEKAMRQRQDEETLIYPPNTRRENALADLSEPQIMDGLRSRETFLNNTTCNWRKRFDPTIWNTAYIYIYRGNSIPPFFFFLANIAGKIMVRQKVQ